MEREASAIHREAMDHIDESEEEREEKDADEVLLEALLRTEEEEMMALLAAREELEGISEFDEEDVIMSDIE